MRSHDGFWRRQGKEEAPEGGDLHSAFLFCCPDYDSSPLLRWVTPAASLGFLYLLPLRLQEPGWTRFIRSVALSLAPEVVVPSFQVWPGFGQVIPKQKQGEMPCSLSATSSTGPLIMVLACWSSHHEEMAPMWLGFRLRGELIKD